LATITKSKLVTLLANKKGYKQYAVKDAIDDIFEEIMHVLESGDRVMIRGFGAFEVRVRQAHPAVHPKTGVAFEVPSYKRVAFKPGSEFLRLVRGEEGQ